MYVCGQGVERDCQYIISKMENSRNSIVNLYRNMDMNARGKKIANIV